MLTHRTLRTLLIYDQNTGIFTWRIDRHGKAKKDSVAGTANDKYIRIMVDKRRHLAHRLAWFYVHKNWPDQQIDHINGNGSDNRIINLRLANNFQNQQNVGVKRTNTSGFKNISFNKKHNQFTVAIRANGKEVFVGLFKDVELAKRAAQKARLKLSGEFARDE